ncbi:MAG: hypothetical protein KatS3mg084_0401 [Candidatus Dojkabacteria bacterium]|nr:MAG: hypothetical protein KatS3mg084_0401 [Candidatus Dojkabacteria bacterium]
MKSPSFFMHLVDFNNLKTAWAKQFVDKISPTALLLRSIVYTLVIVIILSVLANIDYTLYELYYQVISGFFVIVFIFEGYFTYKYISNHVASFYKHILSDLLINHLCYPMFTLFSLIFYWIINRDPFVSVVMIISTSILHLLYFYYLPLEFTYVYDRQKKYKKFYIRSETVMHIFKLFSYFTVNLTLLSYKSNNLITTEVLFFVCALISFIYLLFYLYKKGLVTSLNMFIAMLFAIFVSFFGMVIPFFGVNNNAVLNVVYFYLASAVFYHKLEGTFSYKILLEYIAIVVILSIFIAYI